MLKNVSNTNTIQVTGRFDFSIHRDFREVCKTVGRSDACVIDLENATYVDSSALGMMLLLREQVASVRIVCPNPDVRKILEIANFQKLFELH